MRLTRATVITTGAVAAFVVMGAAPALASATQGTTKAASSFGQVQSGGKHRAPDAAMADGWNTYGPSEGGWGAPWNSHSAPLIGVLDDSVTNVAPWQICGSTTVAGVGGSVPILSPNTVLGDCNNANTVLIAH